MSHDSRGVSAEPAFLEPPRRIAWHLRPALWLAKRMTGKDPLPGRMLAHFPKGALGVGIFELSAAHGPKDLDARVLAVARITASLVGGCPFCIDMNAATWREAGLTEDELRALLTRAPVPSLSTRERLAASYAEALSLTPVVLSGALRTTLREVFSERDIVVLAFTIAQVNFWTRFNQGVDVPAAGFFNESVCALPSPKRTVVT